MRLVRFASLLALSSVVGLTGCGGEEPQPEPAPTPVVTPGPSGPAPTAHADTDGLDARPILACGPFGTGSHGFAHELQDQGRAAGVSFSIMPAPDSLDAMYLVHLGHADLGVVHADLLLSPLHGAARAALDAVRPIGVEALRVLVKRDSPAKSIGDLDGKKVALGPLGSSADRSGREVLVAAGLDPDAMDLHNHDPKEAMEELARGEVDAVVIIGEPPADLSSLIVVRALSLSAEEVAALAARSPIYTEVGMGEGGKTVGIPAVLVARKGAQTEKVRELVDALFKQDPAATALVEKLGPALATPIDGPAMEFRAEGKPLRIVSAGAGDRQPAALVARATKASGGAALEAVSSHGALESLALLASGEADLAIVPEALVQELLAGPATAPLLARVRLVAPLWTTAVVLSPPPAEGADLAAVLDGRSILIGEPGSTRASIARNLLRAAGVERDRVTLRSARPADYELRIEDGQPGVVGQARALLLGRVDLTSAQVEGVVRAVFSNRKNLAQVDDGWARLDPAALVAPAQGLKAHEGMLAVGAGVTVDDAAAW